MNRDRPVHSHVRTAPEYCTYLAEFRSTWRRYLARYLLIQQLLMTIDNNIDKIWIAAKIIKKITQICVRHQVHGQRSRPQCDGRDIVSVNGWTEDSWLKTAGFDVITSFFAVYIWSWTNAHRHPRTAIRVP